MRKTQPKVNIILSSYNGEKYIREQIESLLAQDYPNIEIHIRDDGSTDRTMDILKEYEEKGKIYLYTGENKGFCGSFFELLKLADKGEYWSFCDQDDIWLPEKVRLAVEWLEQQKQTEPLLYYSLSEMMDDSGNSLGLQKPPNGSLCFRRALTGTFGVGFSMVINKALRDEMLRCNPQQVHSHDWLAGAIALGFGTVHVNNQVCAKYRRLDTSVTKISLGKKIKWFGHAIKGNSDVKDRNMEFSKQYKEKLSSSNQALLSLFDSKKYSFLKSLGKTFYLKPWRPNLSSEIVMRLLMLTGKV
ncbi:MAG: glycosyltransferase [Lachnospiraceae bacterium]|jgi:glycosyltransferase involved in cell wall biosynthesis|nr:glycosyltransferase [Lachnospiraceae bacterium]